MYADNGQPGQAQHHRAARLDPRQGQAAQDRFDVGEITTTDVALADAQLAATRASLAAAEGQLAVARAGQRNV